ncbi:uncharacterized protein [Manis javanica]|uniref:uncharacterized protein isoform X2 n=1 Tax=Manis javanica TaxID=9974 RepID=UPI003C6D8F5F
MAKPLLCFLLQAVDTAEEPGVHSRGEARLAAAREMQVCTRGRWTQVHLWVCTTLPCGHGEHDNSPERPWATRRNPCSVSDPKMGTYAACQNGGCSGSHGPEAEAPDARLSPAKLLRLFSASRKRTGASPRGRVPGAWWVGPPRRTPSPPLGKRDLLKSCSLQTRRAGARRAGRGRRRGGGRVRPLGPRGRGRRLPEARAPLPPPPPPSGPGRLRLQGRGRELCPGRRGPRGVGSRRRSPRAAAAPRGGGRAGKAGAPQDAQHPGGGRGEARRAEGSGGESAPVAGIPGLRAGARAGQGRGVPGPRGRPAAGVPGGRGRSPRAPGGGSSGAAASTRLCAGNSASGPIACEVSSKAWGAAPPGSQFPFDLEQPSTPPRPTTSKPSAPGAQALGAVSARSPRVQGTVGKGQRVLLGGGRGLCPYRIQSKLPAAKAVRTAEPAAALSRASAGLRVQRKRGGRFPDCHTFVTALTQCI